MSESSFWQQALTSILGLSSAVNSTTRICSPTAISYPDLPGIKVLSLTAFEVHNYSASIPGTWDSISRDLIGVNFCNVTVTYTHPGQHDVLNVQTWLPLKAWNGRFQGVSGGGWNGGLSWILPLRIHEGYASSITDGGHREDSMADEWLNPDGSINKYTLENFAHVSLHELAVIGKSVTESYYGKPPTYSYWNGCSGGGRQGLMLAQRYPKDFDGIIANAPAINWANFIVGDYWPQLIMNQLGAYPELCELNAFAAAATEACDIFDGVKDGILGAPGLCTFDPHTLVGESYDCNGNSKLFTKEAATLVEQTWKGPFAADGTRRWYGFNQDAPLWMVSGTDCKQNEDGKTICVGNPFWVTEQWIRLYLLTNASFDLRSLTYEQYDTLFQLSLEKYDDIISAANPDLAGFRAAGGKMITWHGLSDGAIPSNGSSSYFQQVLEKDPDARDFYRFFEAPGVDHCVPGGSGPMPQGVMGDLIAWVEKGQAPDTLRAEKLNPMTLEVEIRRELCQWPLVSKYIGGDPSQASSFVCDTGFGDT